MSIWQAILFGLIQGLTEFIPISSTAHLTIAGKLLGAIDPNHPEQWTAFMAVIQLGTLIAVFWYFWADIINITMGFIKAHLARFRGQTISEDDRLHARLGWLIIIGTLPIAVIGLALRDIIEGALTKNLWVIAGSLIGLALLLTLAEWVGKQRREIEELRWPDALGVGVAQAMALIPGSSRSGTTITAGLFAGMTRATAARFSFLLSIPAIAASGILQIPKALAAMEGQYMPVVAATAAAAISGYLSIVFLIRFLQRHTTFIFIAYRIALGLTILGILWAGVMSAE